MAITKTIPFPHKQYGMYPVEEDLRDAAYRGDAARIKALQTQYPHLNLNAPNEYGETAAYIACKRKQGSTVEYLLQQPCIDIKQSTILGNNCLLIAVWNDDTALAEKLVAKGADVYARTSPERLYHGNVSALDIAIERGNTELVSFLKPLVENQQAKPSSPLI